MKRPDLFPAPWAWDDQGSFASELIAQPGEDSILYHSANWPMSEVDKKAIAALPELLTSAEELWSDLGKAGEALTKAGLDDAVYAIFADVRKSAQRMQAALLAAGYTEECPP